MGNSATNELLPNRIREFRKARGLTLKQVADTARCSVVQLSNLERGDRTLTMPWMRRIGRALGVDPGALMSPEDNHGILSKEENELLLRYRLGSEEQRWMIISIARIINRVPV
jgi:transcriptional regulator with XRE-family HTH domain